MNRFAKDPKIVGKKIPINNYPMTVVGVSAEGFAGLDPAKSPQIRVPILMKPVIVPEPDAVDGPVNCDAVDGVRDTGDAVGLYGVMAFVMARRTKELGVRIALGAQPGQVLWLVMKEVPPLLAIGLAVGVPAAIGLGQYVSTQLYGVKTNDPWLAMGTMAVLAAVSAVAGLIPARRASRIDPILALRFE